MKHDYSGYTQCEVEFIEGCGSEGETLEPVASKGCHPLLVDWNAIESERVLRYCSTTVHPPKVYTITRKPRVDGDEAWVEVESERGMVIMFHLRPNNQKWQDSAGPAGVWRKRE